MMEDEEDCSEDDNVDVNEEDGLDEKNMKKKNNGVQHHKRNNKYSYGNNYWFTRIISFGYLYPQHNNPAEFIRDQFNRVAEVIPLEVATTKPHELRKKIRNASRPIPNYFLDPESEKQFPPQIAPAPPTTSKTIRSNNAITANTENVIRYSREVNI